jgi:metal-responsive CopG/Arc/MetJ family transcriptional regulator
MMPATTYPVRKVTVSLPAELADLRLKVSRSKLVADALREAQMAEEERLAIEGYRFYAVEAAEFAQASMGAVAEGMAHDG